MNKELEKKLDDAIAALMSGNKRIEVDRRFDIAGIADRVTYRIVDAKL